MANEAVLVYRTHEPIPFTVSNSTGIERGAVLKMTDPMTAIITSATGDVIAGIAAAEKIANDGKVKLAVYRGGIFKMKGSGSITVGDPVKSFATTVVNAVGTCSVNDEAVLGIALETAADTETLLVELRPTTMQLA